MEQRIRFFAPDNIAADLLAADVAAPLAAADAGWRALPGRSAVLSGSARHIHDRPGVVTGPMAPRRAQMAIVLTHSALDLVEPGSISMQPVASHGL
jgi:hypothetical protein